MEAENKQCLICDRPTKFGTIIKDGINDAHWYFCSCGVVFQDTDPKHKGFNKEYLASYKDAPLDKRTYEAYSYLPVIEDAVTSRKMLDVGFTVTNNMEYFEKRGWVTFGIDKLDGLPKRHNVINDDFETQALVGLGNFSLIWMSHVFECFKDPIDVLIKCHERLQEDGILYISTADLDARHVLTNELFPYWHSDRYKFLWTQRALCNALERVGFDIILKRRIFNQRYLNTYAVHIIAQKIHY